MESSQEDRRDECIQTWVEIIFGSHAGERRNCARIMEDEGIFKPLTPYDAVREMSTGKEILSQRRALLSWLENFLDCPDCEKGACLCPDREDLPKCVKEAYLYRGNGDYRCLMVKTGDAAILIDNRRRGIKVKRGDELPSSWLNLLEKLRTMPQSQYL